MRTTVIVITLASCCAVVAGCTGCQSDFARNGGTTGDGGRDLSTWFGDGPPPAPEADLSFDRDAHFIQDPPVMYCGLDGGMFTQPSPPGGTLECPDDKNFEGCPCDQVGMQAPCWPGHRANRNLGICMDGVTTCLQTQETLQTWGPCEGAVLPTPNAPSGAEACECFSHGSWHIANTVPCGLYLANTNPMMFTEAYSANPPSVPGGDPTCSPKPTVGSTWSEDTVSADCAGHFKLCYTIKAGDVMDPKATDCVVGTSCAESDYLQVNMEQAWPPLPAWFTSNGTCVTKFFNEGGYGEMSVSGFSITCDQIGDHVFHRIGYCPPGDPTCVFDGSGDF